MTQGNKDQGATGDTYQGWSNRETSVVSLHLNNEQARLQHLQGLCPRL
jgi:hypothetical protein